MLVSLASLALVQAMWPTAWITGEACGRAAKDIFPDCAEVDYKCFCQNPLYMETAAHCVVDHTNSNSTTAGEAWDHFIQHYCMLHDAAPFDSELVTNIENSPKNLAKVGNMDYFLAYRATYVHLQDKDISKMQGVGLIIYWLGIFFAIGLARLGKKLSILLSERSVIMDKPYRCTEWYRKHVTMPALIGDRHMKKLNILWFYFSVGTRLETLLISGYILLVVIFMLCPYTFMDNDPFFDSRWKQMMRLSSDRSGIIGTVNFPLMVLFATRNNFLIWVTGWSYATFNRFHRAVSRVVYVLLIIHSVTKHVFSASYGASLTLYFYPLLYYRWGVAAMGVFAIMIFFGSLRTKMYELFLVVHIASAIGGVICSIFHLKGIGYQEPLYICFAIWATDILIRLLRILTINFSVLLPPIIGHKKVAYGTMKLYHKELTSVTIKLPIRWHYYPGQYVYLHATPWTFITGGHPFSVVGKSGDGLELVFKARGGFTSHIRNLLVECGCRPNMAVTVPVYVEGPYGVPAPVEIYDEAILFAGGIGITGILGYVEKLCLNQKPDGIRHNVHVVWCVPKCEDFEPFLRRIYKIKSESDVHFELYSRGLHKGEILHDIGDILHTRPEASKNLNQALAYLGNDSAETIAYNDASAGNTKEEPRVTNWIREGRPNIDEIVQEFFRKSQGSIAVVGCGPASMVDNIRSSVTAHMDMAQFGRVDYFEEAFEW